MSFLKNLFGRNYLVLVFLISFTSMIGSLLFSEVYNLEPCKLCWYQRTLMYPIGIMTFISVIFKAGIRKIHLLALSIPGAILAFYHYYIQLTQGNSDLNTCGGGVSCNFIDFRILGFVTIPFLSFLAFFAIIVIILISYYLNKKETK